MAATPSKPTNEFTTTNLVLATYLISEGYEPSMLVLDREGASDEHPQGAWRFDNSDSNTAELEGAVSVFKTGDALVEPESFQRQLNQTRRELFDFLGVN